MKIRFGKKSDKKEYLITQKEAFPNTNLKRESKFFSLKVKNKEIFILENNRKYVGHLCFGKHLISPPFASSIFLEEFAVKKKFRGKGYGTMLLKHVIAFCKKQKIEIIYLSTNNYKENKNFKYYRKLGFKKLGYLDNIAPDKEYKYGQVFFGLLVKNWGQR